MISDKTVEHSFMPGHTIEAIIKKENHHSVTNEELKALLARFDELNSSVVPRAGAKAQIPILQRYADVI